MKMTYLKLKLRPLFTGLLAFAFLWPASAQATQEESLMPETEFIGQPGKPPRGWLAPHPNYLEKIGAVIELREMPDGEGNYLVFETMEPKTASIQTQLEILPEWVGSEIVISAELRAPELVPGEASWHNARILPAMEDAEGDRSYPTALSLDQPTTEWTPQTTRIPVTAGSKILHLNMGLFDCQGIFEVRSLQVTLAAP